MIKLTSKVWKTRILMRSCSCEPFLNSTKNLFLHAHSLDCLCKAGASSWSWSINPNRTGNISLLLLWTASAQQAQLLVQLFFSITGPFLSSCLSVKCRVPGFFAEEEEAQIAERESDQGNVPRAWGVWEWLWNNVCPYLVGRARTEQTKVTSYCFSFLTRMHVLHFHI